MFDEEKFRNECQMFSEYSEGYDKGIESEKNRIKMKLSKLLKMEL